MLSNNEAELLKILSFYYSKYIIIIMTPDWRWRDAIPSSEVLSKDN